MIDFCRRLLDPESPKMAISRPSRVLPGGRGEPAGGACSLATIGERTARPWHNSLSFRFFRPEVKSRQGLRSQSKKFRLDPLTQYTDMVYLQVLRLKPANTKGPNDERRLRSRIRSPEERNRVDREAADWRMGWLDAWGRNVPRVETDLTTD